MPVQSIIKTLQVPLTISPNQPVDYGITLQNTGDTPGEISVIVENNGPSSIFIVFAGSEWPVAPGGAIELSPDGGINIGPNDTYIAAGTLRIPTPGSYSLSFQPSHYDVGLNQVVNDSSPRTIAVTVGQATTTASTTTTTTSTPISTITQRKSALFSVCKNSAGVFTVKGPLGIWPFIIASKAAQLRNPDVPVCSTSEKVRIIKGGYLTGLISRIRTY